MPLIPTKSWVVTQKNGNGWRGFPIGLSAKSVFVAWARCALILGAVIGPILVIVGITERNSDMGTVVGGIALAVVSIGGMIGSYRLPGVGRASRNRVLSLGQQLGLS